MKVERKREEYFEPVVITLEKRSEFLALWHALNLGSEQTLNSYLSTQDCNTNVVKEICGNLWKELDKVKKFEEGVR